MSHTPLIRSPIDPSTSIQRDIQAAGDAPKLDLIRHLDPHVRHRCLTTHEILLVACGFCCWFGGAIFVGGENPGPNGMVAN